MDELLAGRHAVLEALRSGHTINKIWIAEGAQRHQVQPIIEEAKKNGVMFQQVDKRKLEQMLGKGIQHQGVVAQVAPHRYAELDDLFERASARKEQPFFIMLDEIEDPHNLGSIIRTAECSGAHGVIIPKRRAAGITATVAKTSAGAVEHVPVVRVSNLAQTIDQLKDRGVWIAGADAAAKMSVYEADMAGSIAIVIGSEGSGLGRLVRDKCDFLISLPMHGRLNSLNASVAAGICMYEAVRQRTGKPQSPQ